MRSGLFQSCRFQRSWPWPKERLDARQRDHIKVLLFGQASQFIVFQNQLFRCPRLFFLCSHDVSLPTKNAFDGQVKSVQQMIATLSLTLQKREAYSLNAPKRASSVARFSPNCVKPFGNTAGILTYGSAFLLRARATFSGISPQWFFALPRPNTVMAVVPDSDRIPFCIRRRHAPGNRISTIFTLQVHCSTWPESRQAFHSSSALRG